MNNIHKNKNMLLHTSKNRTTCSEIPVEIENNLLCKGLYKKRWSRHIAAYIISFENTLLDKDVESLSEYASKHGWVFRQNRYELSNDFAI